MYVKLTPDYPVIFSKIVKCEINYSDVAGFY